MTKDFISIKEAAELAGVSKKSIERRYKKLENDREYGKLIEKRKVGNSYRYFVSPEFVEKCVKNDMASNSQTSKRSGGQGSDAAMWEIVNLLRNELEQKNKQIAEFQERQREHNILLKNLQERIPQLSEGQGGNQERGTDRAAVVGNLKQNWLRRVLYKELRLFK